ncbi:MAG TPA: hypothetical protein VLO11_00815 [Luteolibacter sp.]|nr:hypothetical protein [Luteolibacter sp.]
MLRHRTLPCPGRFQRRDFDFVAEVLSPEGARCHLEKLWSDPDGMREMLDLKEVLHALLESPAMLRVTPGFYFYVLVRHGFVHAELKNAELADHVAGMLTKRVGADGGDPLLDVTRGFTHAAELISFIKTSRGRIRHHLQVAAGNQFLVLTGLYPDFIRKRHERGIAPGLDYYEAFAARAFRRAADGCGCAAGSSRHLYGTLAEALPQVRRALNRIAEEFVFLGE